jgi:hypothetical protein
MTSAAPATGVAVMNRSGCAGNDCAREPLFAVTKKLAQSSMAPAFHAMYSDRRIILPPFCRLPHGGMRVRVHCSR